MPAIKSTFYLPCYLTRKVILYRIFKPSLLKQIFKNLLKNSKKSYSKNQLFLTMIF